MPSLVSLHARQILDSRGNPTIEVEATLTDGAKGIASIPSGASTGSHESIELRDKDPAHYGGKSVEQAVAHVNQEIAPILINNDLFNQTAIDNELVLRDGTSNLARWGANAILGVSLAVSKAAATSVHLPYYRYIRALYNLEAAQTKITPELHSFSMPTPMFNVMNGGAHTDWQTTDFQEFMIVPQKKLRFAQALEQGVAVYHQLEKVLAEKNYSTLVGDEGGFAPSVETNQAAMELLLTAISEAHFVAGQDIGVALDAAMSELYSNHHYTLKIENKTLTTDEMIAFWHHWLEKYPIMSLEDGLAEDDWSGWMTLSHELQNKIMVVGDDLLVTNPERIQRAISSQACNSLLMKVNQIGTLTESLKAIHLARSAGWKIIVSHRSGETEDTSIADIAVGVGAEYVKMGAPARSERTAKYNQLLRIEEELNLG